MGFLKFLLDSAAVVAAAAAIINTAKNQADSFPRSASNAEACNRPHPQSSCNEAFKDPSSSSSGKITAEPSFSEPNKETSSLFSQLPFKKASGSASFPSVGDCSSCNEGSEDPSFSPTITEPCIRLGPSSDSPSHEAYECPSSSLYIGSDASKGCPSSSNSGSCQPSEGHSSSTYEPPQRPSSDNSIKPCHEALEAPSLSNAMPEEEEGKSIEAGPSSSSSKASFVENSVPSKGPSSLIKPLSCNKAGDGPFSPHNSETLKGFSSDSNLKPYHEAFKGPSQSNTKQEEEVASFQGPSSSRSEASFVDNSIPGKFGPSSLVKPLPCHEAPGVPSCKEASKGYPPVILEPCKDSSCKEASKGFPPIVLTPRKGLSSRSLAQPACHKPNSQRPPLDMDNETPKGFSSPSNSYESHKAHSLNNGSELCNGKIKLCHDMTYEGPSSSMVKEASKRSPSSSKTQAGCLRDMADTEVYKKVVNNSGPIVKRKEKSLDAYSQLIKTGSALFSDMIWKVFFSNDFKNSFPQIKLEDKKARVINRIHHLSLGRHSSKYKIRQVSPIDKLCGLIEVDLVADLCLVWNVDIERDEEAVQIIKIWDIVDCRSLPKLIKRLQATFRVYSEQYIERCTFRRQSREVAVPERWVRDPDFVWFKPRENSVLITESQDLSPLSNSANLENSSISESLLLMKFYAMTSGIIKNLLTAKDGSEVNPPFQLDSEESTIIRHNSSCFILGRSGTGKTTVLTTKLVQREQQNEISIVGLTASRALPEATEMSIAEMEHIKQIFVTLSPLLCFEIKQQITRIQRTLSDATGSANSQDYSNSDYELLLDDDIENKLMGTLPNTFIDVPSQHYPMVLTFRKFLMMLANSVPCPFFDDKTKSSCRRKEIDYDRFALTYWPHLNAKLTKKFDSSTVFTEIMSVIKGSVQAVKSDRGILSKELYHSLNSSTKKLSVPQKEDIYNLFMQYEKMKMEANCYDMADWVKHTYKQLSCGEYHGDKIHFVYIDEVQDFTQAQLSLFSFVCRNIKEGYIFAGDTAQTITRGVHFRFQDGRSLFYTDFKESAHKCVSDIAATASTCNSKDFKPELFQLKHNFRTHMGVVKLANSIVRLLYHFFPQSIDKLDPETSLVWGQLPALLKGRKEDLLETWHTMGAQQVIIVRDEVQKAQLLEQIGRSGLVLTISGCKGLEFQDVLLYNFFSDSAMQNKWKVIYEYPLQTNVMKITGDSEKKTHPTFDVNKHYMLCSELKHLYVAVTRAREHLWIFEDNNDFCKPMLDYWSSHELIETKDLDRSFVFSIKSSSTADDWKKTGLKFFNQQHYEDAMLCFERAGDEQCAKLAKAASLKQKGEKQLSTNRREAIDKLIDAAECFLALEKPEKAAECYIVMGDLRKAGVLYIERCAPPKFEDAGDCFLEAKSWLEAGEAYFGGGCIKKCLDVCFKGKQFEKGLSFIKQWRKKHWTDDPEGKSLGCNEDIDQYLHKCAAIFHQQHSIQTMMMFVDAFSSINSKRIFLRGRNCFHELMSMEEAEGNYLQAAQMAEVKGDLLHAIMLLERAGNYDKAVKKVLLLILRDALWGEQNKGLPFRKIKRPDELLQRVHFLAEQAETSVHCEVLFEVQLIFEEPRNPHEVRYLIAQTHTVRSTRTKLFTTWKALDAMLRILDQRILGPATNQDRNAMLLQTLSLWIDWQDIVRRCQRAILKQDHLQNTIHESAEDKSIREFCFEFFGVTQGGDKVCFVQNILAYWFKGHKKGMLPIEISMKEFAKLSSKFWNEILHEKEKAINEMCDLPTEVFALLWPRVRKAGEMYHIQKLRGATPIVEILDKIADKIISNPEAICTLETTGRLQTIFPFLSETWKKENASRCKPKMAFWKSSIAFNCKNQRLSVENCVVKCGKQLIEMFYSDRKNIQEYISPMVFIALLERVTVMACACKTLLHEMFLPMTLAVEVMCDKVQEVLYHNILRYNDLAGDSLDLLIGRIINIAFKLLETPTDTEEWIKHTQGDPVTDLHPLVLRLTTLLFTILLNSKDEKLKEKVVGKLHKMFNYKAPAFQQLSELYTANCHKACLAANKKSSKNLNHAFAKALTSVGDSLIMTIICNNGPCCKPRDGISTIELDCETDISMKLQALAETWRDSQMPASFMQGCKIEAAAQNVSTEKDQYDTNLDQTALPPKVAVEKAFSETQYTSQMPASFLQDCKTEAAAQNVSTRKDEHNTCLDQTAFPLKVTEEKALSETQHDSQMLACSVQGCEMEAAAQNVSAEKDEFDKYSDQVIVENAFKETQHDSQTPASSVQGCETAHVSAEKQEYNTYLDQTAFPLKVSVEKDLHRLESMIIRLVSVVTSLSHHKEELKQDIQYLDHSHSKHNEYNLKWLKEKVDQVQTTSNAMQNLREEVQLLKTDDNNGEDQDQGTARSAASRDSLSTNATTNNLVNQDRIKCVSAKGMAANQANNLTANKANNRKKKPRRHYW